MANANALRRHFDRYNEAGRSTSDEIREITPCRLILAADNARIQIERELSPAQRIRKPSWSMPNTRMKMASCRLNNFTDDSMSRHTDGGHDASDDKVMPSCGRERYLLRHAEKQFSRLHVTTIIMDSAAWLIDEYVRTTIS